MERGKPDLLRLAQEACRDLRRGGVLVVSNKAGTWRVVHGLERLGIPAFFGPNLGLLTSHSPARIGPSSTNGWCTPAFALRGLKAG